MMFDDTIKLYAASADDNHYGDETEDDNDLNRFEDDEEEEVTMTSDDDEELDSDDDDAVETHVEEAVIFALPPSPATSYEPPTKPSELPVKSAAAKPQPCQESSSCKEGDRRKQSPKKAIKTGYCQRRPR